MPCALHFAHDPEQKHSLSIASQFQLPSILKPMSQNQWHEESSTQLALEKREREGWTGEELPCPSAMMDLQPKPATSKYYIPSLFIQMLEIGYLFGVRTLLASMISTITAILFAC